MLSQRFAATQRLDVQNRLEGYIFLCSTPQGLKKVYLVSVGRELPSLRVLCLCFWLSPGPRIFTNLLKVPIVILLNVPRRYASDDSDVRGNYFDTRYFDLSVAASWVCNKCKEVDYQSSAENPISGTPINYLTMKFTLAKEKVLKLVSQCLEVCCLFETNQFDRVSVRNSLGSCTCICSIEMSSRTTDTCNKVRLLLPSFVGYEFEPSGGTKILDKQITINEWQN